jgi:hypothetical protein
MRKKNQKKNDQIEISTILIGKKKQKPNTMDKIENH